MSAVTLAVPGLIAPPAPLASLRAHLGTLPGLARFARAIRSEPQWSLTFTRAGALTALAAGDEPGTRAWLRIDPVHFAPGSEGLHLVPAEIDEDDAAALAVFAGRALGIDLRRASASAWYAPVDPAIPSLAPPAGAYGVPVADFMPDDRAQRAWLNEAQMVLHEHPVNRRRADHNEPAVNGVWPWGAGVLGDAPALPFARVYTDEPALAGAALACGAVPASAPTAFDSVAIDGDALVQAGALIGTVRSVEAWLAAVDAFERDWLAPALAALDRGALASLSLYTGASLYTLTRRARWRFWQRGDFLATAR